MDIKEVIKGIFEDLNLREVTGIEAKAEYGKLVINVRIEKDIPED